MKWLSFLFLILYNLTSNAQSVFWQESFDPAPSNWSLNTFTGVNDPDANFWDISDLESGLAVGQCGTAGLNNQTLHITNTIGFPSGAAYNAGGLCSIISVCVATNKRAVTPDINTLGKSNITLSFDYIENGDGAMDNFSLSYSINGGASWQSLADPTKSGLCISGQGLWSAYSITLPPACENINNLKIGFNWTNNDDAMGTDPSVALNDIKLSTTLAGNNPPSAVNDTVNVNCNSSFTLSPLSNDFDIDGGQIINLTGTTLTGFQGNAAIIGNQIIITPILGYTGTSIFTYRICDNGIPNACDTAFVVVNVNGICNAPPIAFNDSYTFTCNSNNTVSPALNDLPGNAAEIGVQTVSIINTSILVGGGTVTIGTNNTLNIIPQVGYSGPMSVQYVIEDNGTPTLTDTGIITITVLSCAGVTAMDDTFNVLCNTLFNYDPTSNDNGTSLLVSNYFTTNLIGNIIVNPGTNNFGFNPTNNFTGQTTYTYVVCSLGLCDTAQITFNVTCNLPPTAIADIYTVACNSTSTLTPLLNDVDSTGFVITGLITTGLNGTAVVNTGGTSITYTSPTTGGSNSLQYIICDNGTPSFCDTGIIDIIIAGCNIKPFAILDTFNISCNDTFSFQPTLNDTDANGHQLKVIGLIQPQLGQGSASFNLITNTVTYNPPFFGSGVMTFSVIISDNGLPALFDTSEVIVNIGFCNGQPIAMNDTVTVNCNGIFQLFPLLNDSDPDLDIIKLSAMVASQPNIGSVTTNNTILNYFIPITNCLNTWDSIKYIVCDNATQVRCDTGTIYVKIIGCTCNLPPNAVVDIINTSCYNNDTIDVLANDTDPNTGNLLTLNSLFNMQPSTAGNISLYNNQIVFAPTVGFSGAVTVNYIVIDNGVPILSDTGLININVVCNAQVVAQNDYINISCGDNINQIILPMSNDLIAGQNFISGIITNPLIGLLVKSADSITYTANYCAAFKDSFQYVICNNTNPTICDTAWVYINIDSNCNCNAPIAIIDVLNINCNTQTFIDPLANDFDIDIFQSISLTQQIIQQPKYGTAGINVNGITYTPLACFNGSDTILYQVCDNGNPTKCTQGMIVYNVFGCTCPVPIADFTTDDVNICLNECIDFYDKSLNAATSFSWVFHGGTPTTSNAKDPQNICYNTPGIYAVTLTAANLAGSSIPVTKTSFITVNALLKDSILFISDTLGKWIFLDAQYNGIDYNWSPADLVTSPTTKLTKHLITQDDTISCTLTDYNGCQVRTIVILKALPKTPIANTPNLLWAPNAITANGDNLNSGWIAKGTNIKTFYTTVYDRWGRKVFETDNIFQSWNGATNGVDITDNVFYYYIKATFNDGETRLIKGDITVIY
jgi:gliding motility-associated-like protein